MDRRILESVKEFYKNVKEEELSWDLIPRTKYLPQDQIRLK